MIEEELLMITRKFSDNAFISLPSVQELLTSVGIKFNRKNVKLYPLGRPLQ